MEMPLHNLSFLRTAMEQINTHTEEKLGRPQTLSSTNQTVIKALIMNLCCTKVVLSLLWSTWEHLGMETDSHTTHFASSTYQISLINQVQNHFPTKFRAAAPARTLGSTHDMLPASAECCTDKLPAPRSHTVPAPCLLLKHRDILLISVSPSCHYLPFSSSIITFQVAELTFSDPAKHFKVSN